MNKNKHPLCGDTVTAIFGIIPHTKKEGHICLILKSTNSKSTIHFSTISFYIISIQERIGSLINFYNLSNTLKMKNFILTSITMLFFVSFVINASAQSTTNSFQIFEEKIEKKFTHLKAKAGNVEVIFRDDRLEIFEREPSSNIEKQSFLFFDNSSKTSPRAIGEIKTLSKAIDNQAMAEVMGADKIQVTTFEKVVYDNLYKGANLEISLNSNGLEFNIVKTNSSEVIPFSLSTWNEKELKQFDNTIQFVNHDNIQITSSESSFDIEKNELKFTNSNKSLSNPYSFTLNILK